MCLKLLEMTNVMLKFDYAYSLISDNMYVVKPSIIEVINDRI